MARVRKMTSHRGRIVPAVASRRGKIVSAYTSSNRGSLRGLGKKISRSQYVRGTGQSLKGMAGLISGSAVRFAGGVSVLTGVLGRGSKFQRLGRIAGGIGLIYGSERLLDRGATNFVRGTGKQMSAMGRGARAAKAGFKRMGSQIGHAFRGNQYVKIGSSRARTNPRRRGGADLINSGIRFASRRGRR